MLHNINPHHFAEELCYILVDGSNLSHLPAKLNIRTRIFPDSSGKVAPIFLMNSK